MSAATLRHFVATPYDPDRLKAVIERRPDAVRHFVREMGPVLRGAIRQVRARWDRPVLDEEDLYQEILFALFRDDARALRGWAPDKGRALASYLRVFARFRAHDLLSAAGRRAAATGAPVEGTDDEAPSPVSTGEDSWIEHAVRRYQRECNDVDWRFLVRFANGAAVPEMLAEFGITRAAYDQRVHRLRKRLLVLKAYVG